MRILLYRIATSQMTKDIVGAEITTGYLKLERPLLEVSDTPIPYSLEFDKMFNLLYRQRNMVRINCLDIHQQSVLQLWAKLNFWQLQRVLWMTNQHWLLKDKKYQWIIGCSISFASGFILKWIFGC